MSRSSNRQETPNAEKKYKSDFFNFLDGLLDDLKNLNRKDLFRILTILLLLCAGSLVAIAFSMDKPTICAYEVTALTSAEKPIERAETEVNTITNGDYNNSNFYTNTEPLSDVIITRNINTAITSAECTTPPLSLVYRSDFLTREVRTGDDGKVKFFKSPCVEVRYHKPSYQRILFTEQPPSTSVDLTPPDSEGHIYFQKDIEKVYIDVNRAVLHPGEDFRYNIVFYNQDGKMVFLQNPQKTFSFYDTLNTTIKIPKNEPLFNVETQAQTGNYVGKVKVNVTITTNDKITYRKKLFITKPIQIAELRKINRQQQQNGLSFGKTTASIAKPRTPLTVCDHCNLNETHDLSFEYTFSNKNNALVVNFLGVEFIIGDRDQNTITAQLPTANRTAATHRQSRALAKTLKEGQPINVLFRYDDSSTDNFAVKIWYLTSKIKKTYFTETKYFSIPTQDLDNCTYSDCISKISYVHNKLELEPVTHDINHQGIVLSSFSFN